MLHKLAHRHRLYTAFKYLIYLLLSWNVWLFFSEEWLAAQVTASGGVALESLIANFAATIDTAAWVVLLLLFELETSLLSDSTMKRPPAKYSLLVLSAICYLVIIYAFYGYIAKSMNYELLAVLPIADACTLLDDGWSYLVDLDEFEALDASACAGMAGQALYVFAGEQALADAGRLLSAQRLAWLDVINAGAWLLVVALLQFDVLMQLRGQLKGRVLELSRIAKILVYSVLFLAAVYWGLLGDFLDFWDAFLWLVAFVFIEMNLFQWNAESTEQQAITVVAS